MQIITETKTITTQYIIFNGVKFYKDGKGYWLATIDKKPKRLHVYVWECSNGKVPKGYHIHHVDLDKDNNDIDNLVAMKKEDHLKLHALLSNIDGECLERKRKNLDKYRHLATEWHHTDEAREVSRKNWHKSIGLYMDQMIVLECDLCGKQYETNIMMRDHSMFCSNKCKSAYRRSIGVDDIKRVCIVCEKIFPINKYSKTKTCSRKCSAKLMLLKRNGIRRF